MIDTKYYEKTTKGLSQASGTSLNIEFRLPNAHVCRNGIYIQTTFVLVKNITNKVILGNPFIALLYHIREISEKGLTTEILDQEITFPFVMPPMTRYINLLKEILFSKEINSISKIPQQTLQIILSFQQNLKLLLNALSKIFIKCFMT